MSAGSYQARSKRGACKVSAWAFVEFKRLACKLAYSQHMLGCQPSAGTGDLRAPQRPFKPILSILW